MNRFTFLLLVPAWWGLALIAFAWLGDATPDGQKRAAHFFDRLEGTCSKGTSHATAS